MDAVVFFLVTGGILCAVFGIASLIVRILYPDEWRTK